MAAQFADKVVLITGGGGGIGKAAAARFLEEGARVVFSGTRPEVLAAAQAEIDPAGDRTLLVPGSVARGPTDSGSSRSPRSASAASTCWSTAPASSASRRSRSRRRSTSRRRWLDPLPDLLGVAGGRRQHARARRRRDRQRRLHVGDRCRRHDADNRVLGGAGGRHALTKNLAIELAAERIRVNTVALAFVETPAYRRFMDEEEANAVLEAVNGFHPLGRRGQPGDVVEAILFLAGSGAGWITGTTLPIDGGVLAGRSPALQPELDAAAA